MASLRDCKLENTGDQMELARLFLRQSHELIDPSLPSWLAVLREVGAPECFHKHGTFYEHLFGVYRMLKLWRVPDPIARCGLLHSAYSNSYVNLALFQPGVDRKKVKDLIGDVAEELVHLFCVVNRQHLVYDLLLSKFSDEDLRTGLLQTNSSKMKENGLGSFEKREAVDRSIIPAEGIIVKHIKTGEDIKIPRRLIVIFLILTMADFADQLHNWQDVLFDHLDGKFDFQGNNYKALWPGDVKPGLWMHYLSKMGALVTILLREDEHILQEQDKEGELAFPDLKLVPPPVFNYCTEILDPSDQIEARNLYLKALSSDVNEDSLDYSASLLMKACKYNPWIGEPHLVLAQIYLSKENFEDAEKEARKGLGLMLEWGTNWDKRMTWEGWIAWGRVMEMNAKEKTWPKTAWGMINLGLVR